MAALLQALESPDPDVRLLAASALGEAGNPAAAAPLMAALDDAEPNVAAAAADALGELRHAPAIEALARAARAESFWVRAAAVVALGRLEDERAVPALARVAETSGLERPLVEALRKINHPDGLEVLGRIQRTAPREALIAAGGILAAHPDVEPPAWVVERARAEAEALRVMLVEDDDPAVARALGIAATPSAVETLVALVGPPRRSEAALTGLLAVPPDQRSSALMDSMGAADRDELITLLALLPPQTDPDRIRTLLPFLSHGDATVRAAAAEALGRAPAERTLPLLAAELDRQTVAPEVVRALGGLGALACGALLPLLEDPAPAVRSAAAEALGRCDDASVTDALAAALAREGDAPTRGSLLRALGRLGPDGHLHRLVEALEDPDPDVRLAAIEGLGTSRSPSAVAPLRRMLRGPTAETLAALQALGDLGLADAAPALEPFLSAPDPDQRRTAARAAIPLAAELSGDAIAPLPGDADEWVRVYAARILGRRGGAERARLERLANEDPSPLVRSEARRVLGGKE